MISAEGRPARWSTAITGAVVRILPAGSRDRWERELVAELYGLSRREQLRHTLGVVTRVVALRSAAMASPDPAAVVVVHTPVRCVLRRHSWRVLVTEDGTRYRRCRRCGKDDTSDASAAGGWVPTVG
jgi:hypothetical protein